LWKYAIVRSRGRKYIIKFTLAGKAIQYNITKHIYMNNIKKCHIFIVKVIHWPMWTSFHNKGINKLCMHYQYWIYGYGKFLFISQNNMNWNWFNIVYYISGFYGRPWSSDQRNSLVVVCVLARISKGQGATSEKGTFMHKRWLKRALLFSK
jgi:hypothetical protein